MLTFIFIAYMLGKRRKNQSKGGIITQQVFKGLASLSLYSVYHMVRANILTL